MGRHSAPDDADADDRADGSAVGATPDAAGSPTMVIEAVDVGRHEGDGAVDTRARTGRPAPAKSAEIEPAADPAAAERTGLAAVGLAPVEGTAGQTVPSSGVILTGPPAQDVDDEGSAPGPVATPRRERTGTAAADFALVRSNRALRARCAAAALAPFVVYVVVLLIVGAQTRTYLLFIFIPLITAGLAVGALLDAAHRRRGASEAGQDQLAEHGDAAPADR